jgi:hypothetical protein
MIAGAFAYCMFATHAALPPEAMVLLTFGVTAFLLVPRMMIAANFGQYGHFRPAALDDIRALNPHFFASNYPFRMRFHPVVFLSTFDTAAAERWTSSSLVRQLHTLTRIARRPRHVVPPKNASPFSTMAAIT